MKLFYLSVVVSVFIMACGNNSANKQEADDDSLIVNTIYSWEATIDSSYLLKMVKDSAKGPDSFTVTAVLSFINNKYPEIKLEMVRQSNDTLFVKSDDASYLTQRMGSTGPTLYFGDAVYNLTEIPGIRYVDFAIEEGDHAGPGTYNRESFNNE